MMVPFQGLLALIYIDMWDIPWSEFDIFLFVLTNEFHIVSLLIIAFVWVRDLQGIFLVTIFPLFPLTIKLSVALFMIFASFLCRLMFGSENLYCSHLSSQVDASLGRLYFLTKSRIFGMW